MWKIYSLALVISAAFASISHAEVFTYVKPQATGVRSFEGFSMTDTPCYVYSDQKPWERTPELGKLFASAGVKVIDDSDAKCHILINGYVTAPGEDGKPVTLYHPEMLLQNKDMVAEIGPAITETNETSNKAAEDAVKISSSVTPGGIEAASRIGGMVGGIKGAVGTTALAVVADFVGWINARNSTPPGVAVLSINTSFGRFFGASKWLLVSAAATTKERPETLIKAAIDRYLLELQKTIDADNKTENKNGKEGAEGIQ